MQNFMYRILVGTLWEVATARFIYFLRQIYEFQIWYQVSSSQPEEFSNASGRTQNEMAGAVLGEFFSKILFVLAAYWVPKIVKATVMETKS